MDFNRHQKQAGIILDSISSLIVTSEICPTPDVDDDPLTRGTLGCSMALREVGVRSDVV